MDLSNINNILNIKDKILQGEVFENKEELMLSAVGLNVPVNVVWNNIICPDWQ